jgi:hypothetical protein
MSTMRRIAAALAATVLSAWCVFYGTLSPAVADPLWHAGQSMCCAQRDRRFCRGDCVAHLGRRDLPGKHEPSPVPLRRLGDLDRAGADLPSRSKPRPHRAECGGVGRDASFAGSPTNRPIAWRACYRNWQLMVTAARRDLARRERGPCSPHDAALDRVDTRKRHVPHVALFFYLAVMPDAPRG